MHPKLLPHHINTIIDNLPTEPSSNVRMAVGRFIEHNKKSFTAGHIHSLIDNLEPSLRNTSLSYRNSENIRDLAKSPNFNVSHLKRLHNMVDISDSYSTFRALLDKNDKNINEELYDHAAKSGDRLNRISMILRRHQISEPKISHLLYGSGIHIDEDIAGALANQESLHADHIKHLYSPEKLTNMPGYARQSIVQELSKNPKHLSNLLNTIKSGNETYPRIISYDHLMSQPHITKQFSDPEVFSKLDPEDQNLLKSDKRAEQ